MVTFRTLGAGLAGVALAACGQLTGPDDPVYEARPSVIAPGFGVGIGTVLAADSVRVGEVLAVVVPTQGGGCVRQGETRVQRLSDFAVEVLPYDSVLARTSNVACTADLRVLDHAAAVRFYRRGQATLRVRGRGGDYTTDRDIVVERAVTVY